MAKKFKVTLRKSTIGQTQRQKDAVRCLGLKKIGQHVMIKDNPANRGQIFKVQHLLNVEVV
ncbi:MAG: 50S ribosomal protein L30 [Bdellovibrionaceae bacterium]|jgi:large subunit ribosomal protein L30|nr:50S ribosomal protein L30 [Pseudobdellovibrionaceae bacterium]